MIFRQLLPDQLNCVCSATPVQGHSRSTMTVIVNHWKFFVIAIWKLHLQGNRGKLIPMLCRLAAQHCTLFCTHTAAKYKPAANLCLIRSGQDLTTHVMVTN